MKRAFSFASLLLFAALGVCACGDSPAAMRANSSASNIPCRDNCGGDATCIASCAPESTTSDPGGPNNLKGDLNK